MNKREAKKNACRVVEVLIESYFDMGQPYEDCYEERGGWTMDDYQKLRQSFEELQDELGRRGQKN